MAYKTFQNGYPLPASDLNDYLMKQSVIVFASSAARTADIPTPIEGMITYLEDTNRAEVYNGSAWVEITSNGLSEQTGTTYTISASDSQSTIFVNNASGTTVTVADVLLPGQRIDFVQKGAGTITFSPDSGVTLNSAGASLVTSVQYGASSLVCEESNVYYLIGNLA